MFLEILATVVALAVTRVLWTRHKYDVHKVPSPPGLPIVGHAFQMSTGKREKELSCRNGRWFAELGFPKLMKLTVFGHHTILVRDAQAAKRITKNARELVRLPVTALPTVRCPVIGRCRGTTSQLVGGDPKIQSLARTVETTPAVKAVRRAYLTAYSSSGLRQAFPTLRGVFDEMLSVFEAERQKGPVNVQELCLNTALDVTGAVAIGMRLGGLDKTSKIKERLSAAGRVMREEMASPWLRWYCRMFPGSKIAQSWRRPIDNLNVDWDRIAQDVLRRPDPPEGEYPLWFSLKTLRRPETGKRLEYIDLRAELAMTIVAGVDATGCQMAWLLAAVAANPRVAKKLQQEMDGLKKESLRFEDMGELAYLTAVIKESFRLCSANSAGGTRIALRDIELLGYRFPKGTTFLLPGNRWLSCQEDWGDPHVFRPERWLEEENSEQNYLLGFSSGPRDCVGRRLAMLELRMTLICLLQKYDLSLTVPLEELMYNSHTVIGIEAIDGIWVTATPRTK